MLHLATKYTFKLHCGSSTDDLIDLMILVIALPNDKNFWFQKGDYHLQVAIYPAVGCFPSTSAS